MTFIADRNSTFPAIPQYRFGPLVEADGTTFRLWAPGLAAADVQIKDGELVPLQRAEDRFLVAKVAGCGPGARYKFRAAGIEFPDLASREQDGDTDGWSVVRAPFAPSGNGQPIRPWHETVICEVHVGAVSPEGTFNGLKDRLEHFRDAGYTCLEIMPIAEFPGKRNWGYDGTLIFAPESAYGTPEELRDLVDRAHELGLCLILDVVYNHFGNMHNFARKYVPEWFDEKIETPWGPGINFNNEMVRQFYYENAAMWLAEYDFDGLRFDAIHEIKADQRDRFLGDLAKTARAAKSHAKLVIENVNNSATWLARGWDNQSQNFVAQWNDDIHHVLNELVTGEGKGGYDDRSRDAYADLEKALADGFVHDGEADGHSDGRARGEPAAELPPDAFITFVQNHDQIGNRPDGKRLPERISAKKLDFLHFLAFLAPQIPLFFMGEEAHLRSTFPFFVDLPPEPGEAKNKRRYKEMREMFHEEVEEGELPHPNDPRTFGMAKLPWGEFARDERRAALERFRTLARWRREIVWPLTATPCTDARSARQGNCILVNWEFEAGTLNMALNPNDGPSELSCVLAGKPVSSGGFAQEGDVLRLDAWSAVVWASTD